MSRKSPRTLLQILLLCLLLGTSSSAYGDTISTTSVSVSNLQIVPTFGSVVILQTQFGPRTSASGAAVTSFPGFDEESGNSSQSPTRSEASTSVTFASAGGVSDFTNSFLSANSNVMLTGCLCSAETEGIASLRTSFMIVGGTGNVDVNISALLATTQTLMIDQFSFSAASVARMSLQVLNPDFSNVHSFSFLSSLVIRPPDSSTALEIERQLSEVVTLQFGQQYNLLLFIDATSRGGQNEIPEPATVVLLVSGLGFMAGLVRSKYY